MSYFRHLLRVLRLPDRVKQKSKHSLGKTHTILSYFKDAFEVFPVFVGLTSLTGPLIWGADNLKSFGFLPNSFQISSFFWIS